MSALDLRNELDTMILSASGWRKVFVADRNVESVQSEIQVVDHLLAQLAGKVFADFLMQKMHHSPIRVVLGRDSRPTGKILLQCIYDALVQADITVTVLDVVALPELLSYCRLAKFDGFFYITASHNPVGYNGFKFGLGDGCVLGGEGGRWMIDTFKQRIAETTIEELDCSIMLPLPEMRMQAKAEAAVTYEQAMVELAFTSETELQRMRDNIQAQSGFGVMIDFNGSSRVTSIDSALLRRIGVQVLSLHDKVGVFAHPIVPEGITLQVGQGQLHQRFRLDHRYQLGYVVDCDGDRGNLVYVDVLDGQAKILDAQSTFAISVVSELANLKLAGTIMSQVAVVCNDATSQRIFHICALFGVSCFMSETGEANVVQLAQKKRDEGFIVRICGEGSNGGNITYPSTVRDPLCTVISVLKLLFFINEQGKSLLDVWQETLGLVATSWSLGAILTSLPAYQSTSVVAKEALVTITSPQYKLKSAYEANFAHQWENFCEKFAMLLVDGYTFVNYEGMKMREGVGNRSGDHSGGLRVLLQQQQDVVAVLWLRGSKTEPVMRLMVDIRGQEDALLMPLLEWHKKIALEADSQVMQD
jgi:phosphoglucomutase